MSHIEKREHFYAPLRASYWPELYGSEYSLFDIHTLPQEEVDEIRLISERIGRIFYKVADLLRKAPNQVLWELDFPPEAIEFIRTKTIHNESVIARLDLVKSELGGYRVIEINTDTPTFIKECFDINELICKEFNKKNPNQGMEEQLAEGIRKAIKEAYAYNGGVGSPYVVFIAHDENVEDSNTAKYLMEISELVNTHYCPLEKLLIDHNGVYDENGRKIDVLYRQTYPIEYLIDDYCENTQVYIGLELIKHVIDKKVAIINPPSAFLLQSKGVQTIIWGLYDENEFFTEQEREWILNYMLPTYFEPDWFISQQIPYVQKPCFGREGDTVQIIDYDGTILHSSNEKSYKESAQVYQEFCELPITKIQTVDGEKNAHIIVGSFLINGTASAIGIRAGGMITDNLSCYLPVAVE